MTPFSRWQGRFHRTYSKDATRKSSSFIFYVTRPTFDKLRLVTSEGKEIQTANAIRESIEQIMTSKEEPWEGPEWTEFFIDLGEFSKDSGGKECHYNESKGIVMMRASSLDFSREHLLGSPGGPDEVVVIHRIENQSERSELLSEISDSKRNPSPLMLSDFDPRMVKLLPVDQLNDTIFDALWLLRRQLCEVRVSDDPEVISREQARAMDAIQIGDSPAINITGRPGTGKTTIAQIAVPEACLQPGPKRGKRRILYLTTTYDLMSEAKLEIDGIAKHVYRLNPELISNYFDENVTIIDRDGLIRDFPQEKPRLSIEEVERILDNVRESENITEARSKVIKTLLKDRKSVQELTRLLQNLVFGLFGSKEQYLDWYQELLSGGISNQELYETFTMKNVNLFNPRDIVEEEREDYSTTLSMFLNPFEDETEESLRHGREKLRCLKDFLEDPEMGGVLFDSSDGQGLWTHASILNHIDRNSVGVPKDSIWSEENANEFDAIIIDESQDFSVKEMAIILKRLAVRAPNTKGLKAADQRFPFLFLASGDPLQTIEGSLFNSRNVHINNLYEDWKSSIRRLSREVESPDKIDITADVGLTTVNHFELEANHRNADPIVTRINKIVDQMEGIAKSLGIKRTISQQVAASSRRGFVLLSETQEDNLNKFDRQISDDIWKLVIGQSKKQVDDANRLKGMAKTRATVATIVAVDNLVRDEKKVVESLRGLDEDLASSVSEIYESKHYRKSSEGMKLELLKSVGIHNVSTAKGLTLEAAIALGFGESLERNDEVSEYERLRVLSHYLVALSRPQFALLVWDHNHPQYMTSSVGEMEVPDLEKILSRVEQNLDPGPLHERAMEHPNEPRLWQMLDDAYEKLISGYKEGPDWNLAKQYTGFTRQVNREFILGDFQSAANKIEVYMDSQEKLDSISDGAKILNAEDLVSYDSIEEIFVFMSWISFLNEETKLLSKKITDKIEKKDFDSSQNIGLEAMCGWESMLKDGPDDSVIDKVIKSHSDLRRACPSWDDGPLTTMNSEAVRADRQECVVNLKLPNGWKFINGLKPTFDMVQTGAWSTPYLLLKSLISRTRVRMKNEILERMKFNEPELFEHKFKKMERNLLNLEWVLTSSREPYDLCNDFLTREDLGQEEKIAAIDWIIRAIGTKSDDKLQAVVRRWLDENESKEKVLDVFRLWCREVILNPPFDATKKSAFKIIGDALGKDVVEDILSLGDGSWLEAVVHELLLLNSPKVERLATEDAPRFKKSLTEEEERVVRISSFKYCGRILSEIVKRIKQTDANYPLCNIFLNLIGSIEDGTGKRVGHWIAGNNLSVLQKKNAEYPNIAIQILCDFGLIDTNQSMVSSVSRLWFGSKLTNISSDDEEFIDSLMSLTGGYKDGNVVRPSKIVNKKVSNMLKGKLKRYSRTNLDSLLEQLYKDCVLEGGRPESANNPILSYVLWLNARTDWEKRNPFKILDRMKDNLAESKPEISEIYREGHNYWNGLTVQDRLSIRRGRLYKENHESVRRVVRTIMSERMRYKDGLGRNNPIPREARIPEPSFNPENGTFGNFSNNNPGILAYLSFNDEDEGPVRMRHLNEAHWNFRLSGSYREAMIVSLCKGAIRARGPKTKQKRIELLLEGLEEAFNERPGVFIDHVQVDRRWAARTSTDKSEKRWRGLRSTPLHMFSLRLNKRDMEISPRISKPIGRNIPPWREGSSSTTKDSLELLENRTILDHVNMIETGSGTENDWRHLSRKWKGEIYIDGDRQKPSILNMKELQRQYDNLKVKKSNSVELSIVTGETGLEVRDKPAMLVYATHLLLPYVAFSAEIGHVRKYGQEVPSHLAGPYFQSVKWFKHTEMDQVWRFDLDGELAEYSRSDMEDILRDGGDYWILELYQEVLKLIDSPSSELTKEQMAKFEKEICIMAPTRGLTKLAMNILGTDSSEEEISGASVNPIVEKTNEILSSDASDFGIGSKSGLGPISKCPNCESELPPSSADWNFCPFCRHEL